MARRLKNAFAHCTIISWAFLKLCWQQRCTCSYVWMLNAQSYMYHLWGFLKRRLKCRLFWSSVRLRGTDVRISWFDFMDRLLKYSHWGFISGIFSHNFLFMRIHKRQYNHFQSWGRVKQWMGGKQGSILSTRRKFMSPSFSIKNGIESKLLL